MRSQIDFLVQKKGEREGAVVPFLVAGAHEKAGIAVIRVWLYLVLCGRSGWLRSRGGGWKEQDDSPSNNRGAFVVTGAERLPRGKREKEGRRRTMSELPSFGPNASFPKASVPKASSKSFFGSKASLPKGGGRGKEGKVNTTSGASGGGGGGWLAGFVKADELLSQPQHFSRHQPGAQTYGGERERKRGRKTRT